jgi:UDP-N-acetylmuramoylalanine--D-glutamate ligase
LEAFEQPTIIIAGGYDKDIPFDELGQKIAESAKAAILIGQTAKKIAEAIHKTQDTSLKTEDTKWNTRIEFVDSLAEAVQLANRLAESGDVVLLSPACASYDMFDNFQHRGREFAQLVNRMKD